MAKQPDFQRLVIDDETYETRLTAKARTRKPYAPRDPKRVEAVIPGVISDVHVREGARVRRGDSLMVLEAMKMKNEVFAPLDGRIARIAVAPGDVVARLQLLAQYE